mmetsp:Transcript_12084/g.36005  ORF Transcript_12084/g.36005 Transcript_12084/m.36005 type:complete len:257 (-) Transcript_12084:1665-2435(-)
MASGVQPGALMATTSTLPACVVRAARRARRLVRPKPWRPTGAGPKFLCCATSAAGAGVAGALGGAGVAMALSLVPLGRGEGLGGALALAGVDPKRRARVLARLTAPLAFLVESEGRGKSGSLPSGASESASTPGSSFPSRSSSAAPPPVLTWVSLCSTPNLVAHVAVSPPPMTVVEPAAVASTAASMSALEPPAKRSNSKTPMGPFHTSSAARRTTVANMCADLGPMSRAMRPAPTPVTSSATPRRASGANLSAVM